MSDESPREEQKEATEKPLLFWGLLAVVIMIWAGFWYVIAHRIETPAARGVFGDMFGAVNSLFSGLAFACLVYAIILQRKELSLQRDELRLTREELKLTRDETAAQTALFAQQLKTMRESHEFTVERQMLAEDVKILPQQGTKHKDGSVTVKLLNGGAEVFAISLQLEGDQCTVGHVSRTLRWANDQQLSVTVIPKSGEMPLQLYFSVHYETASGQKLEKRFLKPKGTRPIAAPKVADDELQ